MEVADSLVGVMLVRDTKGRVGGTLQFDPNAWRSFVTFATQR